MKKILFSAVCALLFTSSLVADILRVEAGAGLWLQDSEGTASYTDGGANGQYNSKEEDNSQGYVWALIKHPTPVIPNIRLEYVSVEDEGIASGEFKDFDIGAATTTMSYDIREYDIIPYYNILDNTAWITLDLGLDIRVIDISYTAEPSGAFGGYSGSDTFVIPLLYTRVRTEIPITDMSLEADIKYITTGDSTVYDIRAKIDYTLDFVPVVQPALEIGYRVQKIDIDESSVDTKVDLEFSGLYAGLMFRF